jgi:hypothetical protein
VAAEQLNLLDLRIEAPGARPARPRRSRTAAPVSVVQALAAGEALVEHRYPAALDFLREHGPDAVAVLHLLAVDAEAVDEQLVVSVSTRGTAARLGFLSKDSAHRRLRQLRRAGVIEVLPSTGPTDAPSYVLHLDGTGITVTHPQPPAEGATP